MISQAERAQNLEPVRREVRQAGDRLREVGRILDEARSFASRRAAPAPKPAKH